MPAFGIAIVLVLLTAAAVIFRPVDTSESNSIKIEGTVENISEGSSKDINITLYGDPPGRRYYINRGAERLFKTDSLRKLLGGRKIEIWYADRSLPFSSEQIGKHITRIRCDDSVLFSEW